MSSSEEELKNQYLFFPLIILFIVLLLNVLVRYYLRDDLKYLKYVLKVVNKLMIVVTIMLL